MRIKKDYLLFSSLALLASSAQALADGTVYFTCQSSSLENTYEYPYSSAKFGPSISEDGERGRLFTTEPADGCDALKAHVVDPEDPDPPKDNWIALIDR